MKWPAGSATIELDAGLGLRLREGFAISAHGPLAERCILLSELLECVDALAVEFSDMKRMDARHEREMVV